LAKKVGREGAWSAPNEEVRVKATNTDEVEGERLLRGRNLGGKSRPMWGGRRLRRRNAGNSLQKTRSNALCKDSKGLFAGDVGRAE